ncbi:hypothetical protein SODALDRAFT_272827 [Sodiomyces alkalinus F11]|uniref:Sister chromatid cohesion protein n=1 Tax=Sodiomyces alkalinus (strain CBS 110278 / VKM F-3762 / F11) TaxID=1314773 RepID=A0A3N2Q1X4_SODAK|nr:hypothetical protein SODALDRAFT_272827 [Sodiomyces alkalinus F11]ROT40761.1 hypothetical protein SODALDRAFT_272827 [Sodiomyces alkalinus F11]
MADAGGHHTPNYRPTNGSHGTTGQPQPQPQVQEMKPFTLQQALPYSPQTSVIPFTSDLIPDPTIGCGLPASNLTAVFADNNDFETLNKQALSQEPAANKQLRHAADHILQELRPKQRTFYKFKSITKPMLHSDGLQSKKESLFKGMSPLSRVILDKAPTFIKQAPADNTSSSQLNGLVPPQQQHPPSSTKLESPDRTSGPTITNADAHRLNFARIEVAIPSKSFDASAYVEIPDQPAPEPVVAPIAPDPAMHMPRSSSQPTIAIELPRPTINKEEYLDVPDEPDEPTNLSSRKVKQDNLQRQQRDALGASLDQRQRAEAALVSLSRITKEVFDAVGRVLGGEPGYDHVATLTTEGEIAVTAGHYQKLQSELQKVISLRSYSQVPLDVITRIQRLSDVGIKFARDLDFKLDDSWEESDVENWLKQLPDIETGLKAARTSLRTMCGGREEKELYSEESIQHSIDLFKSVMEGVVVPVVEMRGGGSTANLFKSLLPHKKAIASVLTNCQRLFALLLELIQNIQLSEIAFGSLEFTASSLIFVDNAYYERDSVVGVQRFDGIRLVAMDMLCQIFLMKPAQRQHIFNDLLTSLEKLPVGKQSARQFRLSEGGSIQPLSALIMRLVHASSGKVDGQKHHSALPREDDGDGPEKAATGPMFTIKSEEEAALQHDTAIQELEDAAKPLVGEAHHSASFVLNFIVRRALHSTKSGDTPYRNLLDLFVEDFTTCMDSPDWPAAELLLRQLTFSMMKIWEDGKSAAPAKNMALELLGVMAAAISKLRSHVRRVAESRDGSATDELGYFLSELAVAALEQKNRAEHLVSWAGPYRACLEYLEERCTDDPHLRGAMSLLVAEWAHQTYTGYHGLEEDEGRDREYGRLAYRLRMMIDDGRWLSNEYTFKTVPSNLAKLSYCIVLLRSLFCEHFGSMLNVLLSAMASDQATVRSKSLKSINQLLETDPAILDGDSVVVQLILNCSNDSSPQVRDSAIGLMGKCIQLRPGLEMRMLEKILDRFIDSGVGVRKRAMKLARDIYLRNQSKEARGAISNNLLHRVHDPDEGVRDLARQMMEEVWFAPFYHAEDTPAFKSSLTDHVALMIQTVKSGNVMAVLDKVLQAILSSPNKTQNGPFGVSVKLVGKMFELIDVLDSDDPSVPHGRDALHVLQIFAKADPKLFSFEEIRLLKPHLASFNNPDDLTVFKAVAVIYRQVLPQLSSKHTEFLKEVREQLQKSITKVTKHLLDDVVACLWIIAGLLDSRTPLARLGGSSLAGTVKLRKLPTNEKNVKTFARYAEIVGMVGKHCDLDSELEVFRGPTFANRKGTSVTKLMVDELAPWADPSQPQEARRAAIEAIGQICQAHPRNYTLPNVYTRFEQVFSEKIPVLESAILRSFKEFLLAEERRSEAASHPAANHSEEAGKRRNLTVMGGTNYDDVASGTTQRFLKEITRIALSSLDDHALLAVEVLGSINRQGLVHPKETGTALITLETCPVGRISEVAYMEHRSLHQKHETVIEREYAKAIQCAFNYQRDIVKDTRGATTHPTFQPKLHLLMEVLKISKSKNRQKFLGKLVNQVDFDPVKLDVTTQAMPPHMGFSRFVIENIAFFEYVTVGEVLATVNAMEKIVTSTGSNLAHVIESEIFNVRMDVDQPSETTQPPPPPPPPQALPQPPPPGQDEEMTDLLDRLDVDPQRLRQMTVGAIILLCLWEARTYLRRLYGLGANRREAKGKAASKDLSKSPVKVAGITGDKFWDEMASHMDGLASRESVMAQCRAFVEMMNVDKEFRVADEEEEEDDGGGEGPGALSGGEGGDGHQRDEGGRGRKRKAGGAVAGGRKKRARSASRPRPRGRPRKNPLPVEDDDAEGDMDSDDPDWV